MALNTEGTLPYVADGTDGFKILSLSNPQTPTLTGKMLFATAIYKDIAVNGGLVCLADHQGGTFQLVDVNIPSTPKFLKMAQVNGFCWRVALNETNTKVSVISQAEKRDDMLEIWDITQSQPVREGYVLTGPAATAQDVTLTNGTAYVAASTEGLKVYTSTSTPLLQHTIGIPGDAYGVFVNDTYAYVTGFPATFCIINQFAQ